ncbi:cell filamentation protein Fic, partial [Mesorhizobium sp. M6A.T.Ca.TU.002.02.2.1]
MTDSPAQGSYFYPSTSDDPDRTDVLRNKFGIETHSELRIEEYRATAFRMAEIAEGVGPQGQFDKAHLKAIHGHIFQDVYEWAGHTRDESPIVDGQRVEPIGGLSKGGTAFLHGSRIEMGLDEALKPIRDPDVLRGSTPEQFAERAGQVTAELNYVHPFREGNGR